MQVVEEHPRTLYGQKAMALSLSIQRRRAAQVASLFRCRPEMGACKRWEVRHSTQSLLALAESCSGPLS